MENEKLDQICRICTDTVTRTNISIMVLAEAFRYAAANAKMLCRVLNNMEWPSGTDDGELPN